MAFRSIMLEPAFLMPMVEGSGCSTTKEHLLFWAPLVILTKEAASILCKWTLIRTSASRAPLASMAPVLVSLVLVVRPTALIVKLVDMERVEARLPSVQAPARLAGILLRQLLRVLPRLTALPAMLVDMELVEARLASAQVNARPAGILLPARRLASRVALAGTSPPLGVTTRLTAEVATLVDMELAEARLASAQVSARREGILKRQLLRALGRQTASRVLLVDMELAEAQTASAQATAQAAGIPLRRLLRALKGTTALLVKLVKPISVRASQVATACSALTPCLRPCLRRKRRPAQPPSATLLPVSWSALRAPPSCRTPRLYFTIRLRRLPKLHAAYQRVLVVQQMTSKVRAPALAMSSARKAQTKKSTEVPLPVPHAPCARWARARWLVDSGPHVMGVNLGAS
jgi:hypothetical protein